MYRWIGTCMYVHMFIGMQVGKVFFSKIKKNFFFCGSGIEPRASHRLVSAATELRLQPFLSFYFETGSH